MGTHSFQTVVLRHETPDGSFHFDWLFAVDEPPAARLVCLRLAVGPHEAAVQQRIASERLPDHRTAYLEYQGPISENRGSVTRVAQGVYEGNVGHGKRVSVRWDDGGEGRQVWEIGERFGYVMRVE